MDEVWKDISGYEGEYQVSNLGRVRSLKRSIVLKPMVATNGYLVISLWKDNVQRKHCIHRLVALAFIPNPENLSDVNHLDEDKKNNVVTNLEWCTHLYNMNYGNVRKLISLRKTGSTITQEAREKISFISSRSRWITDGINEHFILQEKIPELIEAGWRLGRVKRNIGYSNVNRRCMNNGKEMKFVKPENIQEFQSLGWSFGRLKGNKKQEVA